MIPIDQMREFVTLAQTLSFTRAAEASFVAQSTLSRHIAALEEELGASLVARSTVNVEITDAGRVAYDAFAAILDDADRIASRYERLKSELESLVKGDGVSVRLANPSYWSEDYTEPLLDELRSDLSPHSVDVMLRQPHEGLSMLLAGDCDALVMPDIWVPDDTGLLLIPFSRASWIVLMDRENPMASYACLQVEDLDGIENVRLEDETGIYSRVYEQVEAHLKTLGVEMVCAARASQVESISIHLRNTSRIALMPGGIEHMQRKYLTHMPLEIPGLESNMCLICWPNDKNPALLELIGAAKRIQERENIRV